LKDCFRCRS